jgi:hypothetical protein
MSRGSSRCTHKLEHVHLRRESLAERLRCSGRTPRPRCGRHRAAAARRTATPAAKPDPPPDFIHPSSSESTASRKIICAYR